jgi:AraC-like DNA-binding protein
MPGMTSQRRHEAPDIGSMIRRMVRALVRRAAEGDTEALEQLAMLETELPVAVAAAGRLMHHGTAMPGEQFYSYGELAQVLGISRQAARMRFGAVTNAAMSYYYTNGR